MKARAVLFDLDGTLADTLGDIVASCNHVLRTRGIGAHSEADYRPWIGAGVHHLARLASGLREEAEVDAVVEEFRIHYAVHMFDRTDLYPGVGDLLEGLIAREVPMTILSNKPHPATVEMARRLLSEVPFVDVAGARPERPAKPDPGVAIEQAEAMGFAPADCLFVGDTEVDIATGLAAGMTPVGVGWGFRSIAALESAGAARIIEHPRELLEMIWNPSGIGR